MENYNPPNLILNPKPLAFKAGNQKRQTFSETIPKITAHVPAPTKYNTTYDWTSKNCMPTVTQKMSKAKKITYLEEIYIKNKVPEKSTPSPFNYLTEKAFDKTQGMRTGGCPKQLDLRTTFMAEKEAIANFTPAPDRYKAIDTVSLNSSFNLPVGCFLSPNSCC